MNGQNLWKYSACLAAVAMLVLATTSSAQLLISFEESEGFPTAAGDFNGLTTNGGAVTWSNDTAFQSDSSGDGIPGPALLTDLSGGGAVFGDTPTAIDGAQVGALDARENGSAQAGIVTLDLDNSLNLALDSFHWSSRGNQPHVLHVDYFDTNDNLIGTNTYQKGDFQAPAGHPCETNGRGCSVFHIGWMLGTDDYGQSFQEIKPTAPFQGVPLGKITLNSISDLNRHHGPDGGSTGHGAFTMDAINLVPATKSKFNPNNHHIVNFDTDHAGGFIHDGDSAEGYSVPGVATFNNLNQTDYSMHIDHGPGNPPAVGAVPSGFGPVESDEPVNGHHQLLMSGDTGGGTTALLEIDIDDSLGGALQSLWLAFRGNGCCAGLEATLEYFDLGGSSLGSETFSATDDNGLGLDDTSSFFPEYDQVVVGSAFNSTPMSKAILTYTGGGPSDTYYLDHVVISPEPGTMVLLTLGGLLAMRRRSA